jgi:hypothetical protein
MSRLLKLRATRPDQLHLLDGLQDFRRCGKLCDVRLQSRNATTTFPAHRLILSLASSPLGALISDNFSQGLDQGVVLVDIPSGTLAAVLDFIYTGQAHVHMTEVHELLQFAHMYEMVALVGHVVDGLTECLNADTCTKLFPLSSQLGLEALELTCEQFI